MQQNMRPITNPDFNAEFAKWQDIFSTAPENQVKHYLLSGDPVAKLAAAAIMDQKSKQQAPAQAPTQSVINKLAQSQPQGIGQLQMPQAPQGQPQQMPQGQPAPQMAQAPQMPQGQPVPQQMAEGGLTQLPVGDMFNEASYAGGGIIAFDDGGYVPGFAEKSYVDAYDEYNKYLEDADSQTSSAAQRFFGTDTPQEKAYKKAKQAELNRLHRVTGAANTLFDTPGTIAPKPGIFTPTTAQEREAYKQRDELIKNFAKGEYDPKRGVASLVNPAAAAPVADPAKQLPVADPAKQLPVADPAKQLPGLTDPKLSGTKFNLTNPFTNMQVSPKTTIDKETYLGAAPDADKVQDARKAMYERAGVSEKMYDDAKAGIKGQLSDVDSKKKDAVANAMLMAGLGMMGGKSQYALQNIAEGALPAVKGYRDDVEKIEAKKERLQDKIFALDEAKNKFRQTGADSDLAAVRALETDYRNANRSLTTAQAELDEKHNTKVDNLKVTSANAALEIQKAQLDFKLKQDGLALQRASLAVQKFVAEKPELFDTILRNLQGSKAYQNADAVTKNEMITKAVSDARATAPTNDNTLRTEAGRNVRDQITMGPVKAKYNQLLKDDPTGVKADAYKDELVRKEILRLKQDVSGGATASTNAEFNYDPTNNALVPFTR